MKILILEEDITIRHALRMAFRRVGYEVVDTGDPVDALYLLGNDSSDVILIDGSLHGSTAEALLDQARIKANIPVVVLASKPEIIDWKQQHPVNRLTVLSTDFSLDVIIKEIDQIITKHSN
jgi:DNA-binding response OmpR family regulator